MRYREQQRKQLVDWQTGHCRAQALAKLIAQAQQRVLMAASIQINKKGPKIKHKVSQNVCSFREKKKQKEIVSGPGSTFYVFLRRMMNPIESVSSEPRLAAPTSLRSIRDDSATAVQSR